MDQTAVIQNLIDDTLMRWLYDPLVGKLVFLLLGITGIVIVIRFVRRNLARVINENSTHYQVRKLINFLGYFLVALLITVVFSDRLGGFTVAFGVAGAGIAFALQEVITSIAGWIAVTFSAYYHVGDRVQLGGIRGDVIDIGVLRTTIMQIGDWVEADQYNGRIVRISNSFVFKEPVFNYSIDFPFLWDEIALPIKHGSDRQLTRQIIQKAADEIVGEYARKAKQAWKPMTRKYLIEPANVMPMVTLTANENWLVFTLRYVVDYRQRRSTKDKLFMRLLDEFEQHGDRVEIASTTLNIEKLAPLDVRLAGRFEDPAGGRT